MWCNVSLSACSTKCFARYGVDGRFRQFDIKRKYFADNNKVTPLLDTLMRYGQLYQSEKSQAPKFRFSAKAIVVRNSYTADSKCRVVE